jgi:AraC-like DNA-binding protein
VQSQWAVRTPAPALRGLVTDYTGYRYDGARPGVHLGLPSTSLTAIVSLDAPVLTLRPPEPSQPAVALHALVCGLHPRAAHVHEQGHGRGLQIGLTPAGARCLLGMPSAELGGWVLPLDELLGPPGSELLERLHAADTWDSRFDVLDDVLVRCRGRAVPADPAVERAWVRLTAGTARVADVAAEVGYSPRHLGTRFAREFGMPPKVVARLARFDRSRRMLQVPDPPRLADVAAACGFTDQAHLTREWRAFAEAPPTAWRAGEDLLYVQEEPAAAGAR